MSARTVKEDVQASCEDLGLDSNPLQFGFATLVYEPIVIYEVTHVTFPSRLCEHVTLERRD